MKNKISIISILFVFFLQAIEGQISPSIRLQLQPDQTYSQAIVKSMQQLNADRIPYGVLYDRVVGWASLPEWNIEDTTSFIHIKQAWWDLENSQDVLGSRFDPMNNTVATLLTEDKIPLIAINFGFGYVDSLAISSNIDTAVSTFTILRITTDRFFFTSRSLHSRGLC